MIAWIALTVAVVALVATVILRYTKADEQDVDAQIDRLREAIRQRWDDAEKSGDADRRFMYQRIDSRVSELATALGYELVPASNLPAHWAKKGRAK